MAGRLTEIIRLNGLKFEETVQSSMAIDHSTDRVGQADETDIHPLAYMMQLFSLVRYREVAIRRRSQV
jgi:hypothetical protein